MAITKLTEEISAKGTQKTDKERYSELLSAVQAKVYMIQANPASQAEFPEFAELLTFADKLA